MKKRLLVRSNTQEQKRADFYAMECDIISTLWKEGKPYNGFVWLNPTDPEEKRLEKAREMSLKYPGWYILVTEWEEFELEEDVPGLGPEGTTAYNPFVYIYEQDEQDKEQGGH